MKKKLLIPVLIVASYYFMGTESGKTIPAYPCGEKINQYLRNTDTTYNGYQAGFLMISNDTIWIRTYRDSAFDAEASAICNILKDSCRLTHQKILFVDTTSDPALANTIWGKSVYITQCP